MRGRIARQNVGRALADRSFDEPLNVPALREGHDFSRATKTQKDPASAAEGPSPPYSKANQARIAHSRFRTLPSAKCAKNRAPFALIVLRRSSTDVRPASAIKAEKDSGFSPSVGRAFLLAALNSTRRPLHKIVIPKRSEESLSKPKISTPLGGAALQRCDNDQRLGIRFSVETQAKRSKAF